MRTKLGPGLAPVVGWPPEVVVERMSPAADTSDLLVRCDCGFEVRGPAETLVPAVIRHGLEAHNMKVSREQVLEMAQRA